MLFRALVKCTEIIGEAASRISTESKAQTRSVPWDQINGMRNRLIHAYFDINRDIVWQTVACDLPEIERVVLELLFPNANGH